jgi:hypothetical protein
MADLAAKFEPLALTFNEIVARWPDLPELVHTPIRELIDKECDPRVQFAMVAILRIASSTTTTTTALYGSFGLSPSLVNIPVHSHQTLNQNPDSNSDEVFDLMLSGGNSN